ncbi:MAG: hypothetical protein WD273_00540 [Trueperaceae bacterium]
MTITRPITTNATITRPITTRATITRLGIGRTVRPNFTLFPIALFLLMTAQVALAEEASSALPGPPADGTLTAAVLLERFEERLLSEPGQEDVGMLERELERQELARQPSFSLRESSSWDLGQVFEVGVGGSVSLPVSNPEAVAHLALGEQRLLLARFNANSQRSRRREEFLRSLRLLAHVEEVEALLVEHRRQLLKLRPEWSAVETDSFDIPDPARIGYLEMIQALARTRGERVLLAQSIAYGARVDAARLANMKVGRPALPHVPGELGIAECSHSSEEVRRVEFLLHEEQLASQVDASRGLPKAQLDLSGGLRYATGVLGNQPWNGDFRLALRVVMPTATGVAAELDFDVRPDRLGQAFSLSWPRDVGPSRPPVGDPEEVHRGVLEESRLRAMRVSQTFRDASARRRLRELELMSAQVALTQMGAGQDPALLAARAQAELSLLNAELEVDLARIELTSICGGA